MKKTITILALAALAFTSCKKEETATAPPTEETVDTTTVATDTAATAAAAPQQVQQVANPATGSVMTANPQAAAQSYTTTPATVTTAKGMNPPHGQPGHRCDIAVGAPLNSPPGKAAPAKTTSQSTTITPAMLQNGTLTASPGANVTTTPSPATTTPAPVVTAPGMNPPHGQPGHDCAIAVGAPLPKKD